MATIVETGWKAAKTQFGDTLQRVAYRELQDSARWPEIVWLNGLLPPFLTGDPTHPGIAAGTVILWGASIKIPAPSAIKQGVTQTDAFGIDVALSGGSLTADAFGGLEVVAGAPNLKQALEMRLKNDIGNLPFHPKYGNAAHRLRGKKADYNARLLALRFCQECLLADPRVRSIESGSSEQSGDAIVVTITAVVDDGAPLRLQIEI
jgi:hypothetical protein